MLCHDYKCIFVHIPKCGGQSVELAFLGLLGLAWENRAPLLLRPTIDPSFGPPRLAHLAASEYVGCGHVTQAQFNSYFKFSFVRNPWDRIVSEYRFRGYQGVENFRTFVLRELPEPSWSDEYRHIVPQHELLCNPEGDLLVDFVGRFESFQEDFNKVCNRLSISSIILPHVNRSLQAGRHPHYTEYYDDEAREFVGSLYSGDVEMFGYTFGG
jgi:hypothetical protein